MLKKILLAFIASVILFTSTASPALAASGTWYNQTFVEWFQKVNTSPPDEIFGERYTAAQIQWIYYGIFNFFIGVATNGNNEAVACLLTKNLNDCRSAIQNINFSSNNTQEKVAQSPVLQVFGAMGNSPISFTAYIKDVKENLVFIPKAEAQENGFGFRSLNPALEMWKAFRNISYGLMVLVVVAFAFMIMFRVKISPQAVIGVQSALPKIAITLIFITFSYAIAGLLIDLMYIVMGLLSAVIVGTFAQNAGGNTWQTVFGDLTGSSLNFFTLFGKYWLELVTAVFISIFTGGFVTSFLMLIVAILSIVLLGFYILKVFVLLIKNYVEILLLVIFSPIILLAGAITPQGGVGGWIRNLLSKLAIYPVIAMLFVMAEIFLRMALPADLNITSLKWLKDFTTPGNTWAPPFTAFGTGAAGTNLLWIAVSFGIIVMIPKVSEIIQGFMSGKGYDYGTAIGEAVGTIKAAANSKPAAIGESYLYNRFIGSKLDTGPDWVKKLNTMVISMLENRATK